MFGSSVRFPTRLQRHAQLLAITLVALLLPSLPGAAEQDVISAQEVRTTWTAELGVFEPSGLAYVEALGEFLVVGTDTNGAPTALRLGADQDLRGRVELTSLSRPETLAYDPSSDRVLAVTDGGVLAYSSDSLRSPAPLGRLSPIGGLGGARVISSAFDSTGGDWLLLTEPGTRMVRVPMSGSGSPGTVETIRLTEPARLITFDPSSGTVLALGEGSTMVALDDGGRPVASYDLGSVELVDPVAMTLAPTSDTTDDAANLNLFVADAGGGEHPGGLVEVSLAAVTTATVPVDSASLVRVTATSGWSPGSPDPSGVTYLGQSRELLVVDSEVDEVTGAGWNNVNMWRARTDGSQTGTGAAWGPNSATYAGKTGYSREPTGVGHDPNGNTIFVSDDNVKKVFVVGRGPDNTFGTRDDEVSAIDAGALGSGDTEDPEYDILSRHLFVLDGVGMEIFRIDPVDGVFGNANDVETQFDISHLGPKDFEGLASNPARDTLFVGARSAKQIFEITKTGTVLRIISVSGISGLRYISGLAYAPASDGSGSMNFYIVDRQVDNGSNSSENDGRLFEVRAPDSLDNEPPQNRAPVVSAGPDLTVTLPNSANIAGSVTDDGLPAGASVTQAWSVVSAPPSGSVSFSDPTSPTTTASFSAAGVYTLRLTATDTELTASDDVNVSVNPPVSASEFFATSQSTVIGTVSGGMENTRFDDGVYQRLTEQTNARGLRAKLEHIWTFDLSGGGTFVFRVNAFRSGTEDFRFAFSTNGSTWKNMVVVQAGQDGTEYRYTMPSGTSGTVYVRVRDIDRTQGDTTLDTVTVDRLVFTTGG